MLPKYAFPFIICMFLLMGCDTTEKTSEKSVHDPIETKQNYSSNQKNKSLENRLLPPKFSITKFEMNYIPENKELTFLMNYEIDLDIYEILQENTQKLYFSLEYPEAISDIFHKTTSEAVLAEQPKDHKTTYQTPFKLNIDLTTKELENIKNHLSGFNLIIADKDKDPIAHFIDLNGFNPFDPDTSNSTHKDETTK
ncbi:hypothetical protein [Peribacillus sp. SI8-4]|uniref:hypothetical protein n=1 Tax=Peribacillus sp. SI8-4 TaxID=3048009 RepID=UPI0025565544|nr:hypothetical protein [Peribacillus sp. SI8-4]